MEDIDGRKLATAPLWLSDVDAALHVLGGSRCGAANINDTQATLCLCGLLSGWALPLWWWQCRPPFGQTLAVWPTRRAESLRWSESRHLAAVAAAAVPLLAAALLGGAVVMGWQDLLMAV